jgi:hypothetical protein
LGIPLKIRASLIVALAWGFVVGLLSEALLLVAFLTWLDPSSLSLSLSVL